MLLPGKCMSKLFNGLLLELLTSTYMWLYMLQLAIDANFQLESKLQGASSQDPTLGPGWSYFVDHFPNFAFNKDYVNEEEVKKNTFIYNQHC